MNSLDLKLEELIEKRADDLEISTIFKQDIKEYFKTLDGEFNAPGSFSHNHTKKVENYIQRLYKYVIRDSFGNYMPPLTSIPVAFVAMGSFGREELAVYSDIDLMIVYKEVKGFNIKPLMERVLYLAWDAGLKLGHRVHEVSDLAISSETDVTIRTAMLESRFMFGSKFLWMEIENKLQHIRNRNKEAFIEEKLDEFYKRQAKTPQKMEPNLKETIGGSRDANTLYWITKTLFGINKLRDLAGSVINDDDFKDLYSSLEFLNKARIALHLIAKKKEDRVLSQYQRDLALKLGFTDTTQRKAERQLMKRIFTALNTVNVVSRFYIDKVLNTRENKEYIFIENNNIYVSESKESKHINRLLEFYLESPIGIDFHITFTMALKLAVIPNKLSKQTKKYIFHIFNRADSHKILAVFAKAEVLDRLIPPFKPIIHLPQFDGYHKESVDTHSIDTLKFLNKEENEFLYKLFDSLKPDEKRLLRIVALLHDAGKGRKKDHSELGAKIIKVYGATLGLKDDELEIASTLIKHHTLMSKIANKEDIYSEKTLLLFLSMVKTEFNLKLLYLLTIADIKAVGGVFTEFSGNIIKTVYLNSLPLFKNEERINEATRRARKEKKIENLLQNRVLFKKITSIESNLFFIKYSPDEIINLVQEAVEVKDFTFSYTNKDNFSLKIFSAKSVNLGWFLGELSSLNVINMDIFKLTFGVKYFKIDFKERMVEEDLTVIPNLIEASFDDTKKAKFFKLNIQKEQIDINCDHSPTYAKMTLNTEDKRGLMSHVIEVFDNYNIDIASAKITTIKNRTNDLFLVEKNGNFCKLKNNIIEDLTKG